jgi:LysM repeat protein
LIATLAIANISGIAHAAQPVRDEYYTTQEGDTWESVAAGFGLPVTTLWQANGIINPALLEPGLRLFIPSSIETSKRAVVGVLVGGEGTVWRGALNSGNPISIVLYLNGLPSLGQGIGLHVYAPNIQSNIGAIAEAQSVEPTPLPIEPTPTVDNSGDDDNGDDDDDDTDTQPVEGAFDPELMGIQGHFFIDENQRTRLLDRVAYDIDFGWVKQQIRWEEFEYLPGQYSDVMVEALDLFMDEAQARGLKIMLSIVAAPDWARSTTEEAGPPDDFNAYNEFVKWIVLRYKYRINAIEIWNEPNLGREWRGGTISGAEYVRLLAGAYDTIKTEYPEGNITVVSAGLAPTGVNDGVNAIDDRVFLRQMYEAGLVNYTDAIGIHPYSWANPPWTRCCGDWGGAPTHNNHPSFFFLDTIEDYRAIQADFDDSGRQMWATEFGWGTMDGLDRPTPPETPYFNYINKVQQSEYIVEAFRMGQSWDFMGPMFLWNLNIATLPGLNNDQSAYSIMSDFRTPRDAFYTLRDLPKLDAD